METGVFFERNRRALSRKNPELSARLAKAGGADDRAHNSADSRYEFREARNGGTVPALREANGSRPLHSMMDPRKEAQRLIATVEPGSFLILLALGGGYYAEAALERDDISAVFVIEYGLAAFAELLSHADYTRLFEDARFHIAVDAGADELAAAILSLYQPVLSGGIRVIPLRARTGPDAELFAGAGIAVESAINRVSADYSVQAHFGTRWFSNIVRNLAPAGLAREAPPRIHRAAITAAGPSLSAQIPELRKKRRELFLIATDTSLPCLLREKITPDAVISIDCQHISYYHFMSGLPEGVLLFLDLASPPLLARLSNTPRFFLGAHPLARYISRVWKSMPELDTSGGNVTYAALSLADTLGADRVELYGADFSYPGGVSYARGAYIYSLFDARRNRFFPGEAQASAFLYRTPLEKKSPAAHSWYYETEILKFYREKLEEKSETVDAELVPVRGLGAPLRFRQGDNRRKTAGAFVRGEAAMDAREFLESYRNEIEKLPGAGKNAAGFLASLEGEARAVFTTMLPAAAAIKQRNPALDFSDLIEETKAFCVKKIDAAAAVIVQ